jgi:hypothetical protein
VFCIHVEFITDVFVDFPVWEQRVGTGERVGLGEGFRIFQGDFYLKMAEIGPAVSFDHTGSNEAFGTNVDSVVQENTKTNMAKMDEFKGGSVVEEPKTIAKALASLKNVDTIINGHVPVSTWNDLKEYQEFLSDFVTFAKNEIKANKSVDQAAAEYKVPAKYKGYVVTVNPQFGNAKDNLQIAYSELKK